MDAGVDAFQGEVGTSEEEREQIGQTVPLPDTTPSINLDPHRLESQGFWRVSTTLAEGCRHNAVQSVSIWYSFEVQAFQLFWSYIKHV